MSTGRMALLRFVALTLALVWSAVPSVAQESPPPEPAAPSCDESCRGLGIERVKVSDEHCGFVARERKQAVLEAACKLAHDEEESFKEIAREEALESCARVADADSCSCEGSYRAWENIFTHVFSQKCWATCGWAYVLECVRGPEGRQEPEEDPVAVAPERQASRMP